MAQSEQTGLFQFLKWGTSAADTAIGLWAGGDLSVDPDARSREGSGGQEVRRGGLCKFGGNFETYVSATNQALVGYGLRASYPRGSLTELAFEGGADEWSRQYLRSLILDGELSYAQGEGLRYKATWGALQIAAGSGATALSEDNPDIEDYELVATFQGATYGVLDMTIKWSNNVVFRSNGDTKTTGQIRWPVYYLVGAEDLTVDVTCGRPLPLATIDLFEDDLPSNLGMVLQAPAGGPVMTLTNLQPQPETFGQKGNNDQIEWKYGFKGSKKSGSLAWSWAA